MTATDVTAVIGEDQKSSVHARYGAAVYGAITDASTEPALGKWIGGNLITQMTNAPYRFKDLQVYLNRLWVLGGTLPGTTTPVLNGGRVLYWTDANLTADLSLTASWTDDVSGLVNQIQYDGDDTPIGLAGCGKYMAILGSRSINILTGSGSSTFAVRNLTKGMGCTNVASIVEVDDGFYFQSQRGLAFCDGSTVRVVSDAAVTRELVAASNDPVVSAWDHGYIALGQLDADIRLYHIPSQTWTRVNSQLWTSNTATPGRSLSYQFVCVGKDLWRCENVTQPLSTVLWDSFGGSNYGLATTWRSRAARLSSPSGKAMVGRVILDYNAAVYNGSVVQPGATGFTVKLLDAAGATVYTGHVATQSVAGTDQVTRQRAQLDVFAELDVAQIEVSWDYTTPAPEMYGQELYDAYLEYTPAQETAGF